VKAGKFASGLGSLEDTAFCAGEGGVACLVAWKEYLTTEIKLTVKALKPRMVLPVPRIRECVEHVGLTSLGRK